MSRIINNRKIIDIDCTQYKSRTLNIGHAGDVHCTELRFIVESEYADENLFQYNVVFDKENGESCLTFEATVVDNSGEISLILPTDITYREDGLGYSGSLQLFIISNNNGDLISLSSKFPFVLKDSLVRTVVQPEDVPSDIWGFLEELIAHGSKITVWNYSKSAENDFVVPTSQVGRLGELIVITVNNNGEEGGKVFQCVKTAPSGGSTLYYWEQINLEDRVKQLEIADSILYNAIYGVSS